MLGRVGRAAPVVRGRVRRVQHLVVLRLRPVVLLEQRPRVVEEVDAELAVVDVDAGLRLCHQVLRSVESQGAGGPSSQRARLGVGDPGPVREDDDDLRRAPVDDRSGRARVREPAFLVRGGGARVGLDHPAARRVHEQGDRARRLRSAPGRSCAARAGSQRRLHGTRRASGRGRALSSRASARARAVVARQTADVPARYGPGYVLARAPSRRSADSTTRSPPMRRVTRFAATFDDHPVSWRRSYQSGEPGRSPRRSASASTPSFTVEAAGKLASEFQPAQTPVARSWTQNALQPR